MLVLSFLVLLVASVALIVVGAMAPWIRKTALIGAGLTLVVALSLAGVFATQDDYFHESYWDRLTPEHQQLVVTTLSVQLFVCVMLAILGGRFAKRWIVRSTLLASGLTDAILGLVVFVAVLAGN
jgi:hypothetical protein